MEERIYGALGQPGVTFLWAILIGAVAGYIAEKVTKSNMGIFANIGMGILGAVVGNFVAHLLGIDVYGRLQNLISATLGAIAVIMVYRAIRGRTAPS
jgi:uncharacterized membrane protein YeaQ/YmgE (transglycosylase-associated protein family)